MGGGERWRLRPSHVSWAGPCAAAHSRRGEKKRRLAFLAANARRPEQQAQTDTQTRIPTFVARCPVASAFACPPSPAIRIRQSVRFCFPRTSTHERLEGTYRPAASAISSHAVSSPLPERLTAHLIFSTSPAKQTGHLTSPTAAARPQSELDLRHPPNGARSSAETAPRLRRLGEES